MINALLGGTIDGFIKSKRFYMNKRHSVIRKVLLSVSSIVSAIAIILAIVVTNDRATSVENTVEQDIRISTQQVSNGIHEFFRERSRVITSLTSNPFIHDWFESYTERGSDISTDPNYRNIVSLFKNESAADPTIKSVFYAPAQTHEYFDINGRYNDSDYYTNKRPWWDEALSKDRLFITKPEIDANDKSIVTSIKSTIYGSNNQLLGVMGIDILASEIKSSLIDNMSYQGLGYGFLYSNDGQIITFPDESNRIDMGKLPKLNQVDNIYSNAGGFADLMAKSANQKEFVSNVTWKNENYLVFVTTVEDDVIALDWRVAFMVPQHVIDEPVNQSIFNSILIVIFIILLTSAVVVLTIQKLLTTPLKRIVAAMDDIATGDGDLTQRINMDRNDELGQLSDSFNLFVENIQNIIKKCNITTELVVTESNGVSRLVTGFGGHVSEQKGFIEQIATAATEMTQTVHGISDNAQTALEFATQATAESAQGQELAVNATNLMTELSDDVATAADVVEQLHKNSESITAMLAVIKGIAEQTNLLALNAAIEAARAGEQGRGFAVVADEVRTLASRTQASTVDIEKIISTLHASAAEAVAAMNVGKDKTVAGVELINQVSEKLSHINQAISLIEEQSNEIASSTREQATASEEISRQTVSVNELADMTVAQTDEMATRSETQRDIIVELEQTISQFNV